MKWTIVASLLDFYIAIRSAFQAKFTLKSKFPNVDSFQVVNSSSYYE